jgi:hypothetical protein
MLLKMSASKTLAQGRLWYFKTTKICIEMTSNMIYIVALGVGFKCLRKIHLNTQWGGGGGGLHWNPV